MTEENIVRNHDDNKNTKILIGRNEFHIDRKIYPNFAYDIDFLEKELGPQSMQFMIDCLPTIRKLISRLPRENILKVLDVGTATGAGSHLLVTISKGIMFGPAMKVDALDHKNNKYEPYPALRFPDINYSDRHF